MVAIFLCKKTMGHEKILRPYSIKSHYPIRIHSLEHKTDPLKLPTINLNHIPHTIAFIF